MIFHQNPEAWAVNYIQDFLFYRNDTQDFLFSSMDEQYQQLMSALTFQIILLIRMRVVKCPQTASFSLCLPNAHIPMAVWFIYWHKPELLRTIHSFIIITVTRECGVRG